MDLDKHSFDLLNAEIVKEEGATGIEAEQDSGEEETEIVEPFDPNKIRLDTKAITFDLLLSRIRQNEIDLAPAFQRKAGIWDDGAQSRLIESILMNIPLPAFYMDATNEDCWLVIDGLQRLTALKRFVLDQSLSLKGMEFLKQFNHKKFQDLPRGYQRRIQECQVTVYLIQKGTPDGVKFNIFKRINTGGLPLSLQEIRHALNQGPATKLLTELSTSFDFMHATRGSIQDKRMADQECVLRFCAFRMTDYTKYKSGDFDGFLNESMARINRIDELQRDELRRSFLKSMNVCSDALGAHAFRKVYSVAAFPNPINKALFETWSVNVASLDSGQSDLLVSCSTVLLERFSILMADRVFENSVSQGTNSWTKVHTRFAGIANLIDGVLHD